MQYVKIHIPDQDGRAEAVVELSGRGRIVCLPDHVYVVPEPGLELLQSLSVQYKELGRGGRLCGKRYKILLPRKHNDNRPVSAKLFEQTFDELAHQFGGLSCQPGLVRDV